MFKGRKLSYPTIFTQIITNKNLEICFRIRFRNGKANIFPMICFRICFRICLFWARTSHNSRPRLRNKVNPRDFLSLSLS